MAKRMRSNPPWADKLLNKYWDKLQSRVGASMMPKGGGNSFDELGCGHYGCVWSSKTKDVVVKITTDVTEAAFIAVYLELVKRQGRPLEGVVEYYDIVQLPEMYRKRPVFVLWRQEAEVVGGEDVEAAMRASGSDKFNSNYTRNNIFYLNTYLIGYKIVAHELKTRTDRIYKKSPEQYYDTFAQAVELSDEYVGSAFDFIQENRRSNSFPGAQFQGILKNYRGVDGVARALAMLLMLQEEMMNHQPTYGIAQFFGELTENGMVAADVHLGNIGLLSGESSTPIVTDPGHILTLDRRWEGTTIPQL